ncbi:MAG TPA: DUF2087 domain-containing protein [Burkholderiales bacterium]|nr:DUF2087 domain-containing protein [Burkholderiales bacterium]
MTPEKTRLALRRMLANGPLTGLPVRRADLELLLELAALRFAAGRTYTEREVNESLRDWLSTFCAPYGIDHVTLRRCMIDAQILRRDRAGSTYRVDPLRIYAEHAGVDLTRLLAEVAADRAARKRARASQAP